MTGTTQGFRRLVPALPLMLFSAALCLHSAQARDAEGRYQASPLRDWFAHLASRKGPCCDVADGLAVDDPDWDMQDGHYRVRLQAQWIDVPADAVISEPNKVGRTMVWPIATEGHEILIRCFLPGPLV